MNNKALQLGLLRNFSPLDGLKSENLHSLARKAALAGMSRGDVLFKQGDADKRTYFLVSGTVELLQHGRSTLVIRSGTPEARNPIAPTHPRHCSCRVISRRAEYVAVDNDVLDMVLMWDKTGRYEVNEVIGLQGESSPSDDWMITLLQRPVFQRIPPANIQAMFMRMERVELRAGERIIQQGAEGDYFYVIAKGRCLVARRSVNRQTTRLAELGAGDTFGEEALISQDKRNANVYMQNDGALMRLPKDDFLTLICEPLSNSVNFPQACQIVEQGGEWMDVRLPSEYGRDRFHAAINVPLFLLRERMNTLDRAKHYVVCCESGRRSSTAAYLLTERGFNASVLKGGLCSISAASQAQG